MDNTSPNSNTSSVQLFQYEGAEVRTVLIDGEAWFVAKDVCGILGLQNHKDAIKVLDEDEKSGVEISDPHGRVQVTNVISEPAVYKLVFRSNKPEAKAFLRWVTHEVLPQVMRSGSLFKRPEPVAVDFSSVQRLAVQLSITEIRRSFWDALMTAFNKFNDVVDEADCKNQSDAPRYAAIHDEDDLSLLRSILSSAEKLIYGKICNLREKQELLHQLIEI